MLAPTLTSTCMLESISHLPALLMSAWMPRLPTACCTLDEASATVSGLAPAHQGSTTKGAHRHVSADELSPLTGMRFVTQVLASFRRHKDACMHDCTEHSLEDIDDDRAYCRVLQYERVSVLLAPDARIHVPSLRMRHATSTITEVVWWRSIVQS